MNLKDKRGFILLITFVFMAVLTIVVSGFMYMVSVTTRSAGTTSADYKMIELADAGIERAYRAIKYDTSPVTETGTADLRGATT